MTLAHWQELWKDRDVFLKGWATTIEVSVLALLLALALGLLFGVIAISPWRPLRWLANAYVQFFQNTPLAVQILFLYYGVSKLPVVAVGVVGLGTYTGAYISEVIRAGILSIHRGQFEAALGQGMTYLQAMRHVILPQAVRVILPPLTNQSINLIKNSSVLALISGGDLIYQADSWYSINFMSGVALAAVGLLYLVLTLPLAAWTRGLEHKFSVGRGVAAP